MLLGLSQVSASGIKQLQSHWLKIHTTSSVTAKRREKTGEGGGNRMERSVHKSTSGVSHGAPQVHFVPCHPSPAPSLRTVILSQIAPILNCCLRSIANKAAQSSHQDWPIFNTYLTGLNLTPVSTNTAPRPHMQCGQTLWKPQPHRQWICFNGQLHSPEQQPLNGNKA